MAADAFVKQGTRKVWTRADGVSIWLPCDKQTYRLIDANGADLSPVRFRTFDAAARAADKLEPTP